MEKWGIVFNRYRVSVFRDVKILETYNGDGHTTMRTYLMVLKGTLKNN